MSALPATPRPASTVLPATTPSPTAQPVSLTFEKLTARQWAKVAKAPDDYIGDTYQLWACITQFDAATGSDSFRGDASYRNENDDYWLDAENSIFSGDEDQLAEFVADDVVVMNVIVLGSITYDTSIGGSQTVPAFLVDKITLKGSCS